jgi:fermentation-respiration switch protein FrsA (DUF1100 family)
MKLLYGVDTSLSSPLSAIEKLSDRPVLFIYSTDDKKVPASESKALCDKYSENSANKQTYWETNNAGHLENYIKFEDNYISTVLNFLNNINKTNKK